MVPTRSPTVGSRYRYGTGSAPSRGSATGGYGYRYGTYALASVYGAASPVAFSAAYLKLQREPSFFFWVSKKVFNLWIDPFNS